MSDPNRQTHVSLIVQEMPLMTDWLYEKDNLIIWSGNAVHDGETERERRGEWNGVGLEICGDGDRQVNSFESSSAKMTCQQHQVLLRLVKSRGNSTKTKLLHTFIEMKMELDQLRGVK